MKLHTTLNDAQVIVVYHVETDEVDCYDNASGSDYSKTVADYVIDSVQFQGINIWDAISPADATALEMECAAHYMEEVAA